MDAQFPAATPEELAQHGGDFFETKTVMYFKGTVQKFAGVWSRIAVEGPTQQTASN